MILSFIIPFFNASTRDISRCLDSIYNSIPEGVKLSDFEVICVNDASTLSDGVRAVDDYRHLGDHPSNLILLHHSVNKKVGGARNTAIKEARGRFIYQIDSDDFLEDGAFKTMIDCIDQQEDVDIFMFDYRTIDEDGVITNPPHHFSNNRLNVRLSGSEFILSQGIDGYVWLFLFRREFLSKSNIQFVENVTFEDEDYLWKVIMRAKSMLFLPEVIVTHTINKNQITNFSGSEEKICQFYEFYHRLAVIIQTTLRCNPKVGMRLLESYNSKMIYVMLRRLIWQLPYRRVREILVKYPPVGGVDLPPVLAAMRRWPRAMAVAIAAVSPAIRLVYKLYILVRR